MLCISLSFLYVVTLRMQNYIYDSNGRYFRQIRVGCRDKTHFAIFLFSERNNLLNNEVEEKEED